MQEKLLVLFVCNKTPVFYTLNIFLLLQAMDAID